ncbi:hypothetical protein QBC35DRAFT_456591 [Podospora australis]|uniref:MARVEL domain-containing protein n=1 Tax=Podospora australis TaxID=1536484 RepID=A0AAN6WJN1_9PEZI|nr:hypothetical protein QBC35DRAFT_456591 [Podospora australis]
MKHHHHHHHHNNNNNTTYVGTNTKDQTGLLTRWVPERLKHSALYRWLLRLTRVFQFISSAVSLGIFTQRFYKIYRLINSIKTSRGVNGYFGAVEGILAAAVLYTLLATLISCLLRGGGPRWLRWLWVLFDILFVGAFIAVAVITSPNGGMAGPKHCYDDRDASNTSNLTGEFSNNRDDSCNLPWGTFILAIVSTVLHAITAAFHEVRDRVKDHRHMKQEQGMAGNAPLDAPAGYQHGTTASHGYGHAGVGNGHHNGVARPHDDAYPQ